MSATGGGRSSSATGSTNSVSLKPIEVPEALQNGEKFIKWDEVCTHLLILLIRFYKKTNFYTRCLRKNCYTRFY